MTSCTAKRAIKARIISTLGCEVESRSGREAVAEPVQVCTRCRRLRRPICNSVMEVSKIQTFGKKGIGSMARMRLEEYNLAIQHFHDALRGLDTAIEEALLRCDRACSIPCESVNETRQERAGTIPVYRRRKDEYHSGFVPVFRLVCLKSRQSFRHRLVFGIRLIVNRIGVDKSQGRSGYVSAKVFRRPYTTSNRRLLQLELCSRSHLREKSS